MIRKVWYVKYINDKEYRPVYVKPWLTTEHEKYSIEINPYFFIFMFILIDTLLLLPYVI